jgi:hypothetical protein
MVEPTSPGDPLEALSAAVIPASLPAAGLPPEAVLSLRRAFAREVRIRLPRLLGAYRDGSFPAGDHAEAALRSDVVMLTEGARLLGDVASVRALGRLTRLVDEDRAADLAGTDLAEAVGIVALLLGRWVGPSL